MRCDMQVILDIETYKDYFLVRFMETENKLHMYFEMYEGRPLDRRSIIDVLRDNEIVTFNGNNYDLPVLTAALCGATNQQLKDYSDEIITEDLKPYRFYKKYGFDEMLINHIDLIEVAPGMASLKGYGARMHTKKLQDLPIEPSASISVDDRKQLRIYCKNDLKVTWELLKKLEKQIDLRREMSKQYGIDLRSKSDAQIAEVVLKSEVEKITGQPIRKKAITQKEFTYDKPEFIDFYDDELGEKIEAAISIPFTLDKGGRPVMPEQLEKLKVTIGSGTYQMGMGGLHSTEKSQSIVCDDTFKLIDRDVASYYPSIILNLGLYPEAYGEDFLNVYRTIVDQRLNAKKQVGILKHRKVELEKELQNAIAEKGISREG